MRKLSDDEIEKAKSMDLLTYFRIHEPEELIQVGPHDFKTKTHHSLCISDNGLWHWTSRGFGGTNALTFLIRVKQMSFPEAVMLLNSTEPRKIHFQNNICPVPRKTKLESGEERKPLIMPVRDEKAEEVMAYLRKRGISSDVLDYCIEKGFLYQSTEKGYRNCVFVGTDENDVPRAASIRGCGGSFRQEAPGSQKKFSFHLSAEDPSCSLLEIYEAPIDAMSGATLRQYSGRNWHSVSYLSLGGLNYMALDHYLSEHPEVKKLRVCLDGDEAGRGFAAKIVSKYKEKGYEVDDCPPRMGKDYNDALCIYCARRREHRNQRE